QDVITDNSYSYRGTVYSPDDKIMLGDGISTADVSLTRNGNDLLINIGDNGDQITVADWYTSTLNRIENLEFADGTVWDVNTLDSGGLVTESQAMILLGSETEPQYGVSDANEIKLLASTNQLIQVVARFNSDNTGIEEILVNRDIEDSSSISLVSWQS
ncbi:MAG: hypothetical protein GY942_17470, partial [Aestuariibacter sp.]|nr:hypothetical protein [Planctomycetota bacterium]MCP5011770.1 hypothetical protein [Aestuariibacter sp.]